MFWCYGLLSFLLVLSDTYGNSLKSRVRRQDVSVQNGQLIDNIFNIPITAIRQTATAAQAISPENSQTIDNLFKIPVSTLEAVGSLVKTRVEQRQQNAQNIQEKRERLMALREEKRKRKEEIQNQRLQQQVTRVVRHHFNDPLGLNSLTDLLVGHGGGHHGGHHISGLIGHHSGLCGNKCHGGILGGHGHRPPNNYEVYENVNENTPTFSWHGITAGFGSVHTQPFVSASKIENKIAPKETKQKLPKYTITDGNLQNKIVKTKYKPTREYDDPPLENKIAPKHGRITFSR